MTGQIQASPIPIMWEPGTIFRQDFLPAVADFLSTNIEGDPFGLISQRIQISANIRVRKVEIGSLNGAAQEEAGIGGEDGEAGIGGEGGEAIEEEAGFPSSDCTVEFRTASNGQGDRIGDVSSIGSFLVPGSSFVNPWSWIAFRWPAEGPLLSPGNVWLTLRRSGASHISWYLGFALGGTLFQDSTRCAYEATTTHANEDFCFRIYV